jgi:very-short-patch-repair endonuclease
MDTKICGNCGRDFSRPSSFSAHTWATTRYCSLACASRARGERLRVRGSETKPCEGCGAEMRWPTNYSARQWAAKRFCSRQCAGGAMRAATAERRGDRRCTICNSEIASRHPSAKTCGSPECRAEHRRTISGPAATVRMKADYASGKRKRVQGISPREKALWPLLGPQGWLWRLRWFEWDDLAFELDFANPDRKLNVEIDGVEHREPRGRARDELRDAELERRGWRVLRVSNDEVDASPEGVAARIAAWAG